MSTIKGIKKQKSTSTQNNPLNPNGNIKRRNKDFNIESNTIIEQRDKK